jgi:hypothetical protein
MLRAGCSSDERSLASGLAAVREPAVTLGSMDPSLASVGWPVVDRVFGFSPHGVFIAIGFAIGAWLFGRLAPRRGI